MRQKIDLADSYAKALRIMPEKNDDQEPLPVAQVCGLTLEELLSEP